jgi:TonB family protein
VAAVSTTLFSNSDGRIPAYVAIVTLHVAAIFGSLNISTTRTQTEEQQASPITVFLLSKNGISTSTSTNWLAGVPSLRTHVQEALHSVPAINIPEFAETFSPQPVVARLPALVNTVTEPPVLDQARSPAAVEFYPESSKKRHESGAVTLEATISGGGTVIGEVKIQHSSGFAALDQAAVRWIRHTLWAPSTQNGFPTVANVTCIVGFADSV